MPDESTIQTIVPGMDQDEILEVLSANPKDWSDSVNEKQGDYAERVLGHPTPTPTPSPTPQPSYNPIVSEAELFSDAEQDSADHEQWAASQNQLTPQDLDRQYQEQQAQGFGRRAAAMNEAGNRQYADFNDAPIVSEQELFQDPEPSDSPTKGAIVPESDLFDAPSKSDIPATDSALTKLKKLAQTPSPPFLHGAEEAVKSFVPKTLGEGAKMVGGIVGGLVQPITSEDVQTVRDVANVARGAPIEQTFQGKPFNQFTTEDWGKFVGTVGVNAAMAIPLFRGLRPEIRANIIEQAKGGETDASTISSTESVPSDTQGKGVDETPPLRQQGETAGAQEPEPVSTGQPVDAEVQEKQYGARGRAVREPIQIGSSVFAPESESPDASWVEFKYEGAGEVSREGKTYQLSPRQMESFRQKSLEPPLKQGIQESPPYIMETPKPVSEGGEAATTLPKPKEIPDGGGGGTVEPTLTSTKNAIVDQERVARGLQPIAADAGTAHPETWAKAEKRLSENPLAGKMLVEDIVDRGREEFSTADEALLLREKIATQTARQAASDRVLDPNLSESDRTQARSDFDALEAHSQRIDEAMHKTGAKWSEFGRFRQLLAADDYSLRGMGDRLRIAKGDKPITPKDVASVKALHDKISDLQGKLDAHEAARTFDTEFKKLVGQSIKEAKAAKTKGTRFTEFMDQKANEARQRIMAKRGRLTTGFDPTAITDEAIIGASHIAKGLTKFADWSGQMLKEFGERVRPYLKDIWDRAKSLHDANAKEYGDKALTRYKTYLGKQTEQIKSKIESGDFTKAQRQKTKLDAEAFTMRANLQKLKNEFERGVNKEAYKNKTKAQKFWDHFVGVERAMKLSGPSVFGKLGVAAMTREVLSPIEASIGYGASKIVPRFAAGTRYGAGFRTVLRSEIKAKAAFFTKGMKELAENVRGKETELDALSGKYGTQPRFWYNRIGDMHAAIKAPVKRAAFTRSLETRMESAVKAGEDINHPEVMTRLSNEAVMDANREIFQENTVVSSMFKMIENKSPVAGRIARFTFPVVKIPVNLFKEFVNLHVGAPVAATRIGMAYWKGVESLPALQREAIIRQLVKGSIGGAGLLWGYYNRDKVRSFFDSVPQWFAHTPMAMVLNEGSYLKDLGGTPEQGKQARKELAYMAKSGIPFMYSITDVTSALDANNSHALLNWINNMTQSTVVPQISSQVAKTMDKPGTFPSNIAQKPNWRVARNPVEAVKLGIPGLRTQVPQHFPRSGGSSSSRNERRSQR